jgi:hypothetical protein
MVMLDHLLSPRRLTHNDLWKALVIAVTYMTFYLSVLDKNGFHLYIILSPRHRYFFFLLSVYYTCICFAYLYARNSKDPPRVY